MSFISDIRHVRHVLCTSGPPQLEVSNASRTILGQAESMPLFPLVLIAYWIDDLYCCHTTPASMLTNEPKIILIITPSMSRDASLLHDEEYRRRLRCIEVLCTTCDASARKSPYG